MMLRSKHISMGIGDGSRYAISFFVSDSTWLTTENVSKPYLVRMYTKTTQ